MNKLIKLLSYGVIVTCCCLQASARNDLLNFIKSCFNNNTTINNNTFNNNIFPYNYLNDNINTMSNVVKDVSQSVVSVLATHQWNTITESNLQNILRRTSDYNIGSGFFVRMKNNKLYVVTSYNIIKDNKQVSIIVGKNQIINAEVHNTDRNNNLAVLKVNMSDIERKTNINSNQIRFINWGDSDNITIGDNIIAVSNMCGVVPLCSNGVILNNNRNIRNNRFVNHTCALNNYYSGGVLVNTRGQIIGIITDSSDNVISSNTARNIVDSMVDNDRPTNGWIGLTTRALSYNEARDKGIIQNAFENNLRTYRSVGEIVLQVTPNSPADNAGIQRDDIIMGLNNDVITDNDTLHDLINEYAVGSTVHLTILRRNNYTSQIETIERDVSLYNANTYNNNYNYNYNNYDDVNIC